MSFFSFLKSPSVSGGTPESKVAILEGDVAAIEAERKKLADEIAEHENARHALLIDADVADEQIVSADLAAERRHARLERLTAIEAELNGKLHAAKTQIAERAARAAFDARHKELDDLSAALHSAHEKAEKVKAAHGAYDAAARAAGMNPAHWHDGRLLVIDGEFSANFAKNVRLLREYEDARRKQADGV